jgi:GntR family transcriptional repressor for pyruvate dehydrogenase complex
MSQAPSPLPVPDARSRAESIAELLRRQILDGKYEPGERLPSERDLASRTGANRASVREALKQLEQLGMIRIRRGGGARVVALEDTGLGLLPHLLSAQRPDRELIGQWLDVWELVLAGAARLAVERGTREEFAEAERLLERLSARSLDPEEFVSTIDALTDLIAVASRNVVLRMVRNGITHHMDRKRPLRLQLLPARKAVLPTLQQLRAALETRDAATVEEVVRKFVRTGRAAVIDALAGEVTRGGARRPSPVK